MKKITSLGVFKFDISTTYGGVSTPLPFFNPGKEALNGEYATDTAYFGAIDTSGNRIFFLKPLDAQPTNLCFSRTSS